MNSLSASGTAVGSHGAAVTNVTLRPSQPVDLEFLYTVYAESRAEEMAVLIDLNEVQKEQF